MTVEQCERFHQDICSRLAAHDRRAEGMEEQLQIITKAQACQAESLAAQAASQVKLAESQEKTQGHLEQASEALELAAKTVAENSKWQAWAQQFMTKSQDHEQAVVTKSLDATIKENWKLITVLAGIATAITAILRLAGKI